MIFFAAGFRGSSLSDVVTILHGMNGFRVKDYTNLMRVLNSKLVVGGANHCLGHEIDSERGIWCNPSGL